MVSVTRNMEMQYPTKPTDTVLVGKVGVKFSKRKTWHKKLKYPGTQWLALMTSDHRVSGSKKLLGVEFNS